MTPIADMVEQMLAQAVPGELIVLAIRTVEMRDAASRDAQRDGVTRSNNPAAVRARKYRQNLKQNQANAEANDAAPGRDASRDAQRDGAATRHNNLTSLSITSEEASKKKEIKKEGIARARGTRVSPDWKPTDADREFTLKRGVDPDELLPEFLDFWMAVPGLRGIKLDWSATWRNRVRQIQTFKKGKPNGVLAAQDRLNAKLAEFERPDVLTEVRGGPGAPDVRLLPAR